ncbi:MAG: hypothetical protein IK152_01200 [Lachnospiraceae bacterium]|nr:hypothetical protein [Lachnospiraceae bacterium]
MPINSSTPIMATPCLRYNGKTPKIEVKSISFAGKKVSLKAKDYKLTYSPKTVKKAGKYTVTLTVKNGKYKGKTGTATSLII